MAPRATPPYSAKVTCSEPRISALDPSQNNPTISVSTTLDIRLPTSVSNRATTSALRTVAMVRAHMVSKAASPSTRSATLPVARASSQAPTSAPFPTSTQVSVSITLPLVVVVTLSAISSPTTPAMTNSNSALATRLPHSAFLKVIGAVSPPTAKVLAGEQNKRQKVKTENLRG